MVCKRICRSKIIYVYQASCIGNKLKFAMIWTTGDYGVRGDIAIAWTPEKIDPAATFPTNDCALAARLAAAGPVDVNPKTGRRMEEPRPPVPTTIAPKAVTAMYEMIPMVKFCGRERGAE